MRTPRTHAQHSKPAGVPQQRCKIKNDINSGSACRPPEPRPDQTTISHSTVSKNAVAVTTSAKPAWRASLALYQKSGSKIAILPSTNTVIL